VVKIEATLPPQALPAVTEALQDLGCAGLTVSEARTDLFQQGPRQHYRGLTVSGLRPALRVEIVVPFRRLEEVLEVLAATARRGPDSGGQLLVIPIRNVTRIRTGESGEDALGR
jgi:nitrogen regulatory protein PII